MLENNVKLIKEKISQACLTSNRLSSDVQAIAVTKTVSSEQAREVVKLGVTHLAENRVDKMLEKQTDLADCPEITWHLIGNLQRRKVKSIINQIDYFHALDSLSLAAEIQKRSEHKIKCFVEVNVSGEDSKHGITIEEIPEFIQSLSQYPNILVVGLMTMAPINAQNEEIKNYFVKLRKQQEKIASQSLIYAPCTELSMGMSQDYPIAIEAGATFVRIGTAFFQK